MVHAYISVYLAWRCWHYNSLVGVLGFHQHRISRQSVEHVSFLSHPPTIRGVGEPSMNCPFTKTAMIFCLSEYRLQGQNVDPER